MRKVIRIINACDFIKHPPITLFTIFFRLKNNERGTNPFQMKPQSSIIVPEIV